MTKAKPRRAIISGFCNPTHPDDSHRRCHMDDCGCWCHWKDQPVPTIPSSGAPDALASVEPPAAQVAPVVDTASASGEARHGLVYDLDEATYHADRTTLSVSGAKTLLKAPALFRWQQDHPVYKNVFDFGTAAHRMVLGVGAELVIHDYDPTKVKSPKGTDAWKAAQTAARARDAVLLLPSEYATVQAMANELTNHKTAMELLAGGEAEVSAYAEHDSGVRMRCRFDYFVTDTHGVDYKSAASVDPTGFAKACANYGYDMQADWYRQVAELIGHPLEGFWFIAQEKEPPYVVEVYQLSGEFLERGAWRNDRARDIYLDCVTRNDWTAGYTGQPFTTLEPPGWTRYETRTTNPAGGIPANFEWSLDGY